MKNHYRQNPDHFTKNSHHYRPFQTQMKWFFARYRLALHKTITRLGGYIKEKFIFLTASVLHFQTTIVPTPALGRTSSKVAVRPPQHRITRFMYAVQKPQLIGSLLRFLNLVTIYPKIKAMFQLIHKQDYAGASTSSAHCGVATLRL